MASPGNDFSLLPFLVWLQTSLDFGCPLRAEVRSLRLKVSLLQVFLSCGGKHHNDNENRRLQALLVHIRTVFRSVDLDIGRCWADFTKISSKNSFGRLPMNMDDLLSGVIQRLELLRPDIHEVYFIMSNCSRSTIHRGSGAVIKNLNSLLENIEDLLTYSDEIIAPVKEEHEAARKSLRFLRDLLAFTAKRCSKLGKLKDLIIHAEFLVDKMSCLLYICSVNEEMNDWMVNEMKMHISSELQQFSPAQRDVRQIYIKALKASKSAKGNSAVMDEYDWGFLDSLQNNILQLPVANFSFTASDKDQILSLHEELQFLTKSFAMYKSSDTHSVEFPHLEAGIPKPDQISNYSVDRISAAIVDMGCLIYSLHNNEQNTDEAKELKVAVSDLLDIIKTAKEDAYDIKTPNMDPSWRIEMVSYYPVISDDEAEEIGEQMINGSKSSHIFSLNAGMHEIEDRMRWLETNLDPICPLKNAVRELRFRAGFLKVFLSFKGKWHLEDGNLKVLLTRICSVFQNANQDIQRLWADMIQISQKNKWCLPLNMDCLLSSAIARLQLLKPHIQEIYTILSKSSRFITGTSDEAVMENLNSLQENIEDLLRCNAELAGSVKEQLEAVRDGLRFLKNFLSFTAKRCSKLGKLKDLLIHAEFLADSMSCLLYLCCVDDKMNDWTVNEMKMHLLSELQKFSFAQPDVREIYIKALKASSSAERNSPVMDEFDLGFLDSLRDNIITNLGFISSNKDQILSLLDKLKFLITFFVMDESSEQHSEHDQMSNCHFERINAVIIDIGCAIYALNDDEKNEKMARESELNKKISDLEAIISVMEEDTRKMYDICVPMSLRSNFPRTNGQGFICSLLWNLKELLNTKADLVSPFEYRIKIVQKELLSLREGFSKISKQRSQCEEELQSQWNHFLDIAYQTEYVIDSFLCGDLSLYCHKLGLFNVIVDINTIKIELKNMENKMSDETSALKPCFSSQISEESEKHVDLSSKERPEDEKSTVKLVIFGEEAQKIREQLTNRLPKLRIISIVGMPGIGKTTLAYSVFQHQSVTYHFHVRARCSLSQVHDKRRVLLEILQQVTAASKQDSDDDDVDRRLYQSLKSRRYLILLDDIWDIQPWEDIKASFPDDENGSRIILTSRFEDIASQIGLESMNFCLSPLPQEKSWEMLQAKLFGKQSCPPELVSPGHEIAAKCKGLPLTIDLVAGVLKMKEIKEWKEVAKSLMTILFEDPQGHCRKVLELSYQNLPDDWKPCFLYFGAFPEDENVPTRDLILLWIAEGFVKLENGETRSLEDVGKDVLDNLISRSLVTVSRRGPLGGVDASRVHDLLHEFAVAKAQEERFMLKIDGKADFYASHVHDQWRRQYRLCIYPGNLVQFLQANSSGPRTRALLCSESLKWDHLPLPFRAFKLLTVLYIPNVLSPYCPQMFRLIHLRLLAISFSDDNIVSRIHELRNLETLIIASCRFRNVYNLPDLISNMVRLRHLYSDGFFSLKYSPKKILEKSLPFYNLQTLYHLSAYYGEDVEKILKLMPNLVELKARFQYSDSRGHPFPRLDFLKKLESLEVQHLNRHLSRLHPCSKIISFPPHLKRLVLSNFGVPWTEISKIGNHEYLEVLELKNGAFRGPIWDMIDGQFPRLKYLSLSDLDIEEWNASDDHLQFFEQLHVASCRKLKELPYCLAEIGTLKAIELFYCSKAAENSAKRIEEEQEEMGNEQLMVNITEGFWSDSEDYV